MSCPAYWNRRIKYEMQPQYPDTKFIQTRRYFLTKMVDGVEMAGVEPNEGDPIKQMSKFLRTHPDPASLVLMYHRAGGFSVMPKPV